MRSCPCGRGGHAFEIPVRGGQVAAEDVCCCCILLNQGKGYTNEPYVVNVIYTAPPSNVKAKVLES